MSVQFRSFTPPPSSQSDWSVKAAHAQRTGANNTQQENPHNLVPIATAEEVGLQAKKQIGSKPFRIATAGYSAPPENYETSTRSFLEALYRQLGSNRTAFVTSPTADKGSIDAITSEVPNMSKENLFYLTAQDYVGYIDPQKFPNTINQMAYSAIPKHVLPDTTEYSKATAHASNSFIATGGRNATVNDFCNAVTQGNKAVILNNTAIQVPAWDSEKRRVGNASAYLTEQLTAFQAGKELPHPETGGLTRSFLTRNSAKLQSLVQLLRLNPLDDKAISQVAQEAAKFLRQV